jgi:hypothetical protein
LVLVALLASAFARSNDWKESLTIKVDGNSLAFLESGASVPLRRPMFTNGAQVTIVAETSDITVEQFRDGEDQAIKTRSLASGNSATFSVAKDGYFRVTKPNTDEANTLSYIVAREARLVSGLSSGGIFASNSRRTYSAKQALDANGDPIPNTNVIVGSGGGPSLTTAITGTITYLFSENQDSAIQWLEEIASLFLFTDGGTEFGLFLGMTATTESSSSFQVGFTFHLDRREQMAISYGLNLVQSERLTRGFREGDTIPFSDLTDITGSKWVAAPFISITYKLTGG